MTTLISGRAAARSLTTALALAGFGLPTAVAAAPAHAAAPDRTWNCRASVLSGTVGALRVEPLIANGDPNGADRDGCATDDAGPASLNANEVRRAKGCERVAMLTKGRSQRGA